MTRGISENAQHFRSATECVNRLTTSNYFDGYFTRLVKNLKRGLVHVFNSSQTSVYKQIFMVRCLMDQASVRAEWELITELPREEEERIASPASIQFGNGRL